MKEISSKRWMSAWLAIFALTLGVSAGFAQVDTGTILGTVKDQSGAVVPGAKVTIVNQGTADSITTLSRSDGTYIVTPLKIGSYRISVELAGFKKEENAKMANHAGIQRLLDIFFIMRRSS